MTAIPPPIDRNISKLRSSVKEGVDVQGSPPQIIPSGRCGRKATLDVHDRKYTALRWLLQTWTLVNLWPEDISIMKLSSRF